MKRTVSRRAPTGQGPWPLRVLLWLNQSDLLHNNVVRVLLLASAVISLSGVGYYMVDPRVTSLHEGLWLAFTTAATVGYGDVVPSNTLSRAFSVVVVLMGLAVLSLVTASIAAALVGNQERAMERDILQDLHEQVTLLRRELAEIRQAQVSAAALAARSDQLPVEHLAPPQGLDDRVPKGQ